MNFDVVVAGEAQGELVVLDEPLSLWGGFDPETGEIIDTSHPQTGVGLSGRIVAMPHGRGSSSSSAVLAEAMRLGTAPAGFLLAVPDGILSAGSIVGAMLYGVSCPIAIGNLPEDAAGTVSISASSVIIG